MTDVINEVREALKWVMVYGEGDFARPKRNVAIILRGLPQLLARIEALESRNAALETVRRDVIAVLQCVDSPSPINIEEDQLLIAALRKSLAAADEVKS